MKLLLLTALGLLLIYLAAESIRIYRIVQVSKQLIEDAEPYTLASDDAAKTLLVLGDSTGVGVGADTPRDSVAGRAAQHIGATWVENYARSGARVQDLPVQRARAQRTRYDTVLIQVGGNDIIAFRSAQRAAQELDQVLAGLPDAGRVVVLSAGNVGGAPLFPMFLRPLYTHLNQQYHERFAQIVQARGHVYVNLYEAPGGKLIEEQPEIYLSKDQLHPSSAGYELWFKAIQGAL